MKHITLNLTPRCAQILVNVLLDYDSDQEHYLDDTWLTRKEKADIHRRQKVAVDVANDLTDKLEDK